MTKDQVVDSRGRRPKNLRYRDPVTHLLLMKYWFHAEQMGCFG